ncbi:MAG: hydrogenase maturation protease [Armatimonadetes bacterium]|nr:hydrogenase maturation protease [Armatimonadota bacterium]
MVRIIGVGNRFVAGDDLGPRVCDHLRERPLPAGVTVLDGGLAGLDLLYWMDGAERVVFVDAVAGARAEDAPVVLTGREAAGLAPARFGHEAGLPYLLRAAELDGAGRCVYVVGLAASTGEQAVAAAASLALRVAVGET